MKVFVADNASDSQFLICREITTPLLFADNLTGVCSRCAAAIQYRPHAPAKPPKICMGCFEANEGREDYDVLITRETVSELGLDIPRKRKH